MMAAANLQHAPAAPYADDGASADSHHANAQVNNDVHMTHDATHDATQPSQLAAMDDMLDARSAHHTPQSILLALRRWVTAEGLIV